MILVTGATGKVGSALVEQLQAQQIPFRALAHTSASYDRLNKQQVHAVLVPEPNSTNVAAAFDDVDKLFLLTPSSPNQAATERTFVDAARYANVQHVVKLSVLGADAAAISLAQFHHESEQYIQQSGIGYTFLRPNSFMQNVGTIDAPLIKEHSAIFNSAGEGKVSFIDARDIAAVAIAAFSDERHNGQAYDLTGPEALTYSEVTQKLTALLDRSINYVALSDDDYRAALLAAGLPDWYANGLTELYQSYRAGEGAAVTNLVEQLTGRPARTFDAYLADHRALFG